MNGLLHRIARATPHHVDASASMRAICNLHPGVLCQLSSVVCVVGGLERVCHNPQQHETRSLRLSPPGASAFCGHPVCTCGAQVLGRRVCALHIHRQAQHQPGRAEAAVQAGHRRRHVQHPAPHDVCQMSARARRHSRRPASAMRLILSEERMRESGLALRSGAANAPPLSLRCSMVCHTSRRSCVPS